MQSKQKITLYIPPELHRKLKIKAAVDSESMSALVERAVSFYMQYPKQVDEITTSAQGKNHQVHLCPECDSPVVMRRGELVSINTEASAIIDDDIALGVADHSEGADKPNEEELVSCL